MIRGGLVTLFVRDVEHAVRFYVESLGMKLVEQAGTGWAVIDAGDGFRIGLHKGGSDEGMRGPRPLPEYRAKKRRMDPQALTDKQENGYFTGLPLVNSDPDTGLGFGARVLYFDNGGRDDRMFEYTPYRHRVYGQAFFTTNGYQYHTVDYDAPY